MYARAEAIQQKYVEFREMVFGEAMGDYGMKVPRSPDEIMRRCTVQHEPLNQNQETLSIDGNPVVVVALTWNELARSMTCTSARLDK